MLNLTKEFEIILLKRIRLILDERGIPLPQQTTYKKGSSCEDTLFTMVEVLKRYRQNSDHLYLCTYDMEKAFGTVEYSILLKHVFNAGINGKAWRILCNWYTETTCCVKVNNLLSTEFTIERGVKQGSILSPIVFTLVIVPLLEKMVSSGLGVSIAGLQLGTMAHADDIRTITNSVEAHQMCTSIIVSYTQENGLKLNQEMCKVLFVPHSENSKPPQTTDHIPNCLCQNPGKLVYL